jgi:imidazolonepropionase-like amidohydrolase
MPTLIKFGTLYSPGTVQHDGHLVVDDGKVAAIGQGWPAQDGGPAVVSVECVTPGLINAHAHLEQAGGSDTAGYFRTTTPTERAIVAVAQASRALRSGVTATRDLGSSHGVALAVRRAVEAGIVPGPAIRAAGAVICMTGGHAAFAGRQADGPADVRKAVREQFSAGADCIKLIATGGVLTPGAIPAREQLSAEELAAGADEAHRHGLPVAAHALGTQGIINAIRAGADSIEHGHLIDDEGIALLLEHDAVLVPTLAPLQAILDAGDRVPPSVAAKARALAPEALANLRRARDAGVRFVAGSDAGTPFNPHDGFGTELSLMHSQLGMSGGEVLRAATEDAARLLGLARGRLEVGAAADLAGWSTDVVATGAFTERPALVMKDGVVVSGAAAGPVHQGSGPS